jgi:hypothetical protein
MKEIQVDKEDIKETMYFIANLTQMQGEHPMRGALSSKQDFMGGILDRWINIIPERVVFNKYILPKVDKEKNVEVITDFYDYNPQSSQAGIAPDVIGIKVDEKAIPFVVFNNKWEELNNAPQIEVKSFKKSQKMVTLRNQGYDNKYLVLVETNFRIDYLLPLLDKSIFTNDIYSSLHMDDSIFIKSDDNHYISQSNPVDLSDSTIGTIKLLKITKAEDFMEACTLCERTVSVEYLNKITDASTTNIYSRFPEPAPLSNYLTIKNENKFLYSFSSTWYNGLTDDGITLRKNTKIKMRTLDLIIRNINQIHIIKMLANGFYITTTGKCKIGNTELDSQKNYKLEFATLDRSSSRFDEYFLQKSSVETLNDYESDLIIKIKNILMENGV